MLHKPIWQLVLDAASKLQGISGDFRLKQLVEEVQREHPSLGQSSIHPVVQGMTSNAGKGPLSPCGKPLYRVQYGLYRLQVQDLDSGSLNRKMSPAIQKRDISSPRVQKSKVLAERFDGVIAEFSICLDVYDRQVPFVKNGQYSWHRATIDRRRGFPNVLDAITDEIFLDDLYETLHMWGIGRRASLLVPRDEFAECLLLASNDISSFQSLRIDDPQLDSDHIARELWRLINSLGVVKNISRIVPGTKTLHHLLPDLVPPMDRAWTGTFFKWSATAPQYEQEKTFIETFSRYAEIARATKLESYVGKGWRTSISKLLDNAIIGYCKINGISPIGTRPKERTSELVLETGINFLESVQQSNPDETSFLQTPESGQIEQEQFLDHKKVSTLHREFQENQKGVSFDEIFGPYIRNSKEIMIIDPYIRYFSQIKNLMEFIETVQRFNPDEKDVSVKLLTAKDVEQEKVTKQVDLLNQVQKSASDFGINFSYKFDETRTIHDRSVTTDTGWKILLGRGLGIYQIIANDPFNIAHKNQSLRKVKQFSVTYIRETVRARDVGNI